MRLKKRTVEEVLAWAERKGYAVKRDKSGTSFRGPDSGLGANAGPGCNAAMLNECVARLPNLTGVRA